VVVESLSSPARAQSVTDRRGRAPGGGQEVGERGRGREGQRERGRDGESPTVQCAALPRTGDGQEQEQPAGRSCRLRVWLFFFSPGSSLPSSRDVRQRAVEADQNRNSYYPLRTRQERHSAPPRDSAVPSSLGGACFERLDAPQGESVGRGGFPPALTPHCAALHREGWRQIRAGHIIEFTESN
jgi:hypothetical protein